MSASNFRCNAIVCSKETRPKPLHFEYRHNNLILSFYSRRHPNNGARFRLSKVLQSSELFIDFVTVNAKERQNKPIVITLKLQWVFKGNRARQHKILKYKWHRSFQITNSMMCRRRYSILKYPVISMQNVFHIAFRAYSGQVITYPWFHVLWTQYFKMADSSIWQVN